MIIKIFVKFKIVFIYFLSIIYALKFFWRIKKKNIFYTRTIFCSSDTKVTRIIDSKHLPDLFNSPGGYMAIN